MVISRRRSRPTRRDSGRFLAAKQKAALRLRGFFAPETGLGLKVRNLAVHAMSAPVVGKWLLAHSLKDDFVLPQYSAA